MIISPTTGCGFSGALSYIHKAHEKDFEENQKPKILQENFVFGTVAEQAKLMQNVASGNARSSRPVLHLSISFHQEEEISLEKRDQIFDRILEELGADRDNHQFVIAQHFDADHEHYHILLNKVGLDRTNINTSYIVNKCQVIADKLEQELNLRKTTGRTIVYDPTSEKGYRYTKDEERKPKIQFLDKAENIRNTKEFLKETILSELSQKYVTTPWELVMALQEKGIHTEIKKDMEGILKGISFRYNNQAYKGSQLGIKSKQIQQVLDNKQKLISGVKESDLVAPVISWKEELQIKIDASKSKQRNLEDFNIAYSKVVDRIIIETKKEAKDVIKLLSIFEDEGFSRKDNSLYGFEISFPILKETAWIISNIKKVENRKIIFEEEKKNYEELMKTLPQEIPFFILPYKRKKLKEENELLKREQDRAKEPVFEVWGLNSNSNLLIEIQKAIKKEISIQEKLKKEVKTKMREEDLKKLIEESKKRISNSHIEEYISVRKECKIISSYIDFIRNYEHISPLKDLFWLDKKFESLDSENEKINFLQREFNLDIIKAESLHSNFFEINKEIILMKVKGLNQLSDRIIRSKDLIPEVRKENENIFRPRF